MQRINYLDGHRGIAILLVIMFHAYSRWAALMPYGDNFANFPIFKFGYLGVQLFFLISGFVIFMSLEKSTSISSFIYRRWLRLFPAMLLCTLLIYMTADFFYERPYGHPELKDIIAGLSFIDPHIWLKLTGFELLSLEGAFWSLYVEFKFYVVAAILYFFVESKRLVIAIFLCFLLWWATQYLQKSLAIAPVSILSSITSILGFKYFGWFAAGAAYYSYLKLKQLKWFCCGVIFSVISALVESGLDVPTALAALCISALFAVSIISSRVQALLNNRCFLFFGFISYPLYLLHENMMVSLTIKLDSSIAFVPSVLLPILAIGVICMLSYIISKYLEPIVKNKISRAFNKL